MNLGSWSQAASDVVKFQHHISQSRILAAENSSASPARYFVPTSALQNYLQPDVIRKLLAYYGPSPTSWRAIQNEYLIVFAILVNIGEATYISHFLSQPRRLANSLCQIFSAIQSCAMGVLCPEVRIELLERHGDRR